MKKLSFFTASLFLLFLSGTSQTLNFQIKDVTTNTGLVSDNDAFEHFTTAFTTTEHDFEVKNISTSTQVITIKKNELTVNTITTNDKAQIYFCTGVLCYDASTMAASMTLAPQEAISFRADLDEASAEGKSSVDYKFSNAGSSLTIGLRYNETVSIRNNSNVLSNTSAAYPNPSSSKTFININSPQQLDNVKVNVLNSLGAVVLTKQVSIASGKNTISIESENFNSGIYFATISYGNSVVTKKITITK